MKINLSDLYQSAHAAGNAAVESTVVRPMIVRWVDPVSCTGEAIQEYVVDDGDVVEPTFYVPILPMILINGALGIGTGWSSSIPCFNPLDIIECVKSWLENDGDIITEDPDTNTTFCTLPELTPWYRGFTGKIEFVKDKFVSYGLIDKDKDKVYVSELPIGMWTDKFKEMCEDWLVDKKIKNFKNNSSYNKVNFTITESDDGFNCNIENIKLYSYLHTTNMVLFNEKEQIKKYTTEGIIDDFCKMRYIFYTKRKNHIISSLEKDLMFAENKARFIQEIMDNKLNIMNVEEDKVVSELEKRKYDKDFKQMQTEDDETLSSGNKHGYEYLLRLQVRTFTANKVKQLKDDITSINGKLRKVKSTTEKEMWMSDIDEIEKEYTKWLKTMDNQKPKKTSKK
jgi:DNA topoisomerase-2